VDDPALTDLTARATALAAEATELAVDVRLYGEAVDADPARLSELQDRRSVLQTLTRKYGSDVDAVLAYADEARQRLGTLEATEADAGDLDERVAAAGAEVAALAEDVRRGRRHAAGALSQGRRRAPRRPRVAARALHRGGRGARRRGAHGLGRRPGHLPARAQPGGAGPAARSGGVRGERSRVSLAVEVALADADEVDVLVFDEVDAGIGGATAMAVGEKLARLATGAEGRPRQVLCVTHLAQLAAFADVHHVVEKGVRGGRTVTTARRVAEEDRVAELARMLGGEATATAGLEHARELLARATERRAS
jgi:DNA repair protein RecN (Recombination protein N)